MKTKTIAKFPPPKKNAPFLFSLSLTLSFAATTGLSLPPQISPQTTLTTKRKHQVFLWPLVAIFCRSGSELIFFAFSTNREENGGISIDIV